MFLLFLFAFFACLVFFYLFVSSSFFYYLLFLFFFIYYLLLFCFIFFHFVLFVLFFSFLFLSFLLFFELFTKSQKTPLNVNFRKRCGQIEKLRGPIIFYDTHPVRSITIFLEGFSKISGHLLMLFQTITSLCW